MSLTNIFQLGKARRTRELMAEMGNGPDADTDPMLRLIAEGVDVDARDKNGWTPLLRAAFFGRTALIQPLIDAGADIHAVEAKTDSNYGANALILCSMKGHTAIAETLLAAGAKIDAANDCQATALHFATWCPATMKCLLAHGAPLDAQNKWGMTPLMCVARDTDSIECLDILLKAGADLMLIDNESKNALDHADGNMRNVSQVMRVPLIMAHRRREKELLEAEERRRQDIDEAARSISVTQKDVAVFKKPLRFKLKAPAPEGR
ncbi:MAG: ankyrin repeat domain-containing protein [Micavibrio sp.]|nr:ankyrin repeat domain-containing protein [Micavibrio sp.]